MQNNEFPQENKFFEEELKSPITANDRNQNTQIDIKYLQKSSSTNELRKKPKINKIEYEEWYEILRNLHISFEDLQKFSKNKALSKLMDAIEMLNNLLVDKNIQIRMVEMENENLNNKNSELNNENIKLMSCKNELMTKINNLKLKISVLDNNMRQFDKNESSSLVN